MFIECLVKYKHHGDRTINVLLNADYILWVHECDTTDRCVIHLTKPFNIGAESQTELYIEESYEDIARQLNVPLDE